MMMDFTAISFADYQHDMDELSARAVGAVRHVRDENTSLKKVIFALVQASGGRIVVDPHTLRNIDDLELTVETDPAIDAFIYRTSIKKRCSAASNGENP